MVHKYEILTHDEIIENYKLIKEKERFRNKEAYERLKLNKVQYRKRLTSALDAQNERMNKIKADENLYNEWQEKNKLIQSTSYYKRMEKNADKQIEEINLYSSSE
jgi:hypothetical protein